MANVHKNRSLSPQRGALLLAASWVGVELVLGSQTMLWCLCGTLSTQHAGGQKAAWDVTIVTMGTTASGVHGHFFGTPH